MSLVYAFSFPEEATMVRFLVVDGGIMRKYQ
jgi:hypothetical protein